MSNLINIKKVIGRIIEKITVKNLNKKITRFIIGKKILDNGCGGGSFIYEQHRDKYIYGIDIEKKEGVIKRGAKEFKKASSTKIPYNKNFFDCIVFSGVIQYINNYQKSIDEIKRVLKPQGRLIIATLNKESLFRRIKVIDPIPKKYAGENHYFSFHELSDFIKKNKFEIQKIKGIDFIKLPKKLCSNILIIAKNIK